MLLALLIYAMPMFALAVGDSLVALDAVKIDMTDQAGILRGGQHFNKPVSLVIALLIL